MEVSLERCPSSRGWTFESLHVVFQLAYHDFIFPVLFFKLKNCVFLINCFWVASSSEHTSRLNPHKQNVRFQSPVSGNPTAIDSGSPPGDALSAAFLSHMHAS